MLLAITLQSRTLATPLLDRPNTRFKSDRSFLDVLYRKVEMESGVYTGRSCVIRLGRLNPCCNSDSVRKALFSLVGLFGSILASCQ